MIDANVFLSYLLSLIHGQKSFKLRAEIKKNGLNETDKLFLSDLKAFLEKYGIKLVDTPNSLDAVLEVMANHSLLPSDALILAACKHNAIKSIATFDSDFKKLTDFEIIGD